MAWPRSSMVAGTSTMRTRVASTATATARPRPMLVHPLPVGGEDGDVGDHQVPGPTWDGPGHARQDDVLGRLKLPRRLDRQGALRELMLICGR